MEFPGVLKKKHVEIPEVNLKRSGISRGVPEKLGEFPWFLVFDLRISKECNTILQKFQR